ncbi:MAG: Gfo/Idh/MocA family oxidoreductase [Candidatus Kapabacteria bacterium]|nr:Gfo/Idh/MocA family oxidoreductase [Candidatus Kapabacteria bacterium]
MAQTGLALIGAGNIAQSIHLPILTKLPNAILLAICDRNLSKAKALAEKYNIPHVCRSIEELLQIDGVQAVDICTSTDAHYESTIACAEGGLDILVEKPLARTVAEARQIAKAVAENNVKLMVGMNHRFRPDTVMLKNQIEQGQLGNVYYVKAGWLKPRSSDGKWIAQQEKSGGGVLLDLGVVMIDMLMYIFGYGKEVRSVSASTFYHHTRSVEDVAVATINFTDDTVASIETSWSLMRPDDLYYCNVYGKKGSAYVNPFKVVRQEEGGFSTFAVENTTRSKVSQYTKSYESEIKHFVNAVQDLIPVVSTGEEAIRTLSIIDALYASAAERCEVRL